MHLIYIMESLSEVLFLSFHPNYDTWSWQKRMRHITATETSVRMIAWWLVITQDVQHFDKKCKNSEMNKPSLGKRVSTWPQTDVWVRLHMDWG